MTVAQDLKAARALISGKGAWCKFIDIKINADGKPSYCALGAISIALQSYAVDLQIDAVATVLKQRWHRGKLPTPIYSGGGAAPIPWSAAFAPHNSPGVAIAQFNNSTSQAEVLALFDEVIEAELAKEAADRPKLVDLTPPAKTRELELA